MRPETVGRDVSGDKCHTTLATFSTVRLGSDLFNPNPPHWAITLINLSPNLLKFHYSLETSVKAACFVNYLHDTKMKMYIALMQSFSLI